MEITIVYYNVVCFNKGVGGGVYLVESKQLDNLNQRSPNYGSRSTGGWREQFGWVADG